MNQEKPIDVSQEGETKADEIEKPSLESVKQLEDSASEVQAPEIENHPNGNEIQSSNTEQELPVELNSEPLECESAPQTEFPREANLATNTEPDPDSESVPNNESEPNLQSEPNPGSETNAEAETNSESADLNASESIQGVAETPGQIWKRGVKTSKDENCDKYGWPIGSKYCTEELTSEEAGLTEDADAVNDETKKEKVESLDAPKEDEEILYVVTSPINKRANMKKTIINVEEVEGAITDGIHAGTHFPYFLTYLSQRIKFRLTISRFPDKKLKIAIKFGGNGGETLKHIVCLWLCREDEDKDKIVCQGLTRNKEEMLILLAQKFQEIEHIKDDPVALFEDVKRLVPELRGKEGLRSKDETFLSAYQDLDEKVRTLMAILYKEGGKREGQNDQTLAQFRDMYFSLQIKPGFTVKQYLWAFYYYNLIFSPYICRDLETMMQKYAASKNITLPSTSALIFPPGGQTSTIENPFAKKKFESSKDTLPNEMGALSSDGFVPPEPEQFKKPMNPKQRTAQRRRQANQRNRRANAGNKGNLSNQRNSANQRGPLNQRNNLRNQPNHRDNLSQRSPQNSKNYNQRSPANQGNQPVLKSSANKRRQGNQGGPVNKKRPANQGGPPIQGVPVNPAPQANEPNQKKPANRRRTAGQRNNQANQRNNQSNQRNNQPNPRNNQPNQRNNQVNQRNSQRNSRPRRRRPDLRSREQSREQNFAMNMSRNLFPSSHNQDFISLNLRNDDFMRNQDFVRSLSFSNNQRSPNYSQSNSRNQGFSQGNHSRSSSFSQSSNPRSLFSQDFFDMPHNQNYSQNNSLGQNFSHQDSHRMPSRASDFFLSSQDFFSGPSNFSNRSNSMNRNMDEMQFSGFNSRMPFDNDRNAHSFSHSSPSKNWDNKSNRGKRKNFRDGWSNKRPKQGI